MAQQQSQPESTETVATDEPATAEGEDTSVAGTEPEAGAPAGDAGAAEGEKPAEGEPKPEPTEEEKAAAEAKEAELKTAAEKYAKDQIQQANRTMAAARRAQKAAEQAAAPLRAELETAKHEAKIYGDFVRELQTQPMTALARLGFKTFKDFAAHVVESGGEKEQTEEERIAALLDRKLAERDAPRKEQERAAAIAEAKKTIFAHIDAQTDRFDLVTTDVGHDRLWKAIEAYHKQHGVVPDAAVDLIAEKVEKELGASLAKSKRFNGQSQPAKNGPPASGAAAPGASTSGKPLAGKPTSGAPAPRKYSLDPDERREQVNADLRAEGLI